MTTVYTYDGAGNLLSQTDAPYTQGDLDEILGTDYYVYNDSISGDILTSYNGHSITYDAIGNPLTYYNGRSYTFAWNGRQMTSATVGGKTYYFTYDSNGLRKTKTVDGVTTTYYYNGDLLISEQNENETIVYIYDANGSPIGMQHRLDTYEEGAWDVYWYEKNLLGDVVGIFGSAGARVARYRYNAYGSFNITVMQSDLQSLVVRNPFRYRGYYFDNDIGLYYLQSRYYDMSTCRFVSPDSTQYLGANGDLMSYNLYAYCSNNPVVYTDPTGCFVFTIGFNISAICLAGFSYDIYLCLDDDGNIGVQTTEANVFEKASGAAFGTLSAGASVKAGISFNADTIYDLNGNSYSLSASYKNFGIDASSSTLDGSGVQLYTMHYTLGKSIFDIDLSMSLSKTQTIGAININELFYCSS